ncbi:hypothetical protein HDV00_010558 [Rhizophlyctis rosea]|nr:hypothetical protein HDV00_010558 [Rhizophlyctis rosea]
MEGIVLDPALWTEIRLVNLPLSRCIAILSALIPVAIRLQSLELTNITNFSVEPSNRFPFLGPKLALANPSHFTFTTLLQKIFTTNSTTLTTLTLTALPLNGPLRPLLISLPPLTNLHHLTLLNTPTSQPLKSLAQKTPTLTHLTTTCPLEHDAFSQLGQWKETITHLTLVGTNANLSSSTWLTLLESLRNLSHSGFINPPRIDPETLEKVHTAIKQRQTFLNMFAGSVAHAQAPGVVQPVRKVTPYGTQITSLSFRYTSTKFRDASDYTAVPTPVSGRALALLSCILPNVNNFSYIVEPDADGVVESQNDPLGLGELKIDLSDWEDAPGGGVARTYSAEEAEVFARSWWGLDGCVISYGGRGQ